MRWWPFGGGGHLYQLCMPRGHVGEVVLAVGDRITITNHGDPEPFCIIQFFGRGKTQITFRDEDERFTEEDLDLLAQVLPFKPLVI